MCVYLILKWDVLGNSFIQRSHSSRPLLYVLFCDPILTCPIYRCQQVTHLNAASSKHNELPYGLTSAKWRLLKKIRMSPGMLMKLHIVTVIAIRSLCQLSVTAGCETHSITAYAGK